jgi:phage recombination protein Bet
MNNEVMKIDFNQETIDLIKSQIAPKATNDELKLFIYQAKRTGLDPLARQIYAIHRKQNGFDKMTIQTSIDGFRVIAERSGDYAGQDEPIFEESEKGLIKATVKVYRFKGENRYQAAVGVAYWAEYCPVYNGQPSGLWAKMPHTMLAKVAEALALRKAYPQDLSGLYTNDEMNQADKQETPEPDFSNVPDEGERHLLRQLVYTSDLTNEEREAAMTAIDFCTDYKVYQKIQDRLEVRQAGIDTVQNPSQKDISAHLRKAVQ